MSWQDFHRLIDEQNTDIAAWMAAIKANPNTYRDALKVAIMDIFQKEDMAMLEKFTGVVVDLIRNADALLEALMEQSFPVAVDGDPVVVIGTDDPREQYDVSLLGLTDLPDVDEYGPIAPLW